MLYHTRVGLLWQLLRPLISTTVLPSVHQRAFGCSAAQDMEKKKKNTDWLPHPVTCSDDGSQLECINDEHKFSAVLLLPSRVTMLLRRFFFERIKAR